MSRDQRDILLEKFNDNCITNDESENNDSDRLDNIPGYLTHTWRAQSICGNSCLQSYECDCDDLSLIKTDTPSSIKANASLRAIAHYCIDDANPYEYEIIDIQASPDTGHIIHPPDPCLKHNERNLQSR